MTYTRDWDETSPIDHTKFSQQPGHVRNFKTDLSERITAFIYGFVSGETDTAFKRIDFKSQAADPSAPAATIISLYAKTVSGAAEFYLRHTSAGVIQLTSLGKFLISALTVASAAAGDIIYHNGTSFVRLAVGTALQYLRTNSGATAPEWATLPVGGVVGSYKKLKVTRGSATQVTVTADELVLEDSSNIKVTIRSVNETAAITTAGADGLDTGAEGSSRWYYIWIIRKSSDGTVSILLSESSTSPTMPTGYDQKALVSAVYNDSSSDFIDFVHEGKSYWYKAIRTMASGVAAAWTSIDTSPYVPSVLSTHPILISVNDAGMVQVTPDSGVSTTQTTAGFKFNHSMDNASFEQLIFELPILTANTLYWGGGSGDSVGCLGFHVNKLV